LVVVINVVGLFVCCLLHRDGRGDQRTVVAIADGDTLTILGSARIQRKTRLAFGLHRRA
jgi:hypothetical protein